MSRIILILSIAMVLFVGAAGLSWYFQPHMPDAEAVDPKEGDAKVTKASAKKDSKSKHEPVDIKPGKAMPINPDASRTAQAMASMQMREESLKAREQHLIMREKQLTAIHDEIKKEHGKLELVRKEIQTELNNVKKKLDEVELRTAANSKEKTDILKGIEQLESLGNSVKQTDAKNAQKNAAIFDKMEPEPLSTMLTQWVEGGKTDEAALLLSHMKQAQAAAVLGELSKQDASLATKLFERMQKIQITADKK
jgi:chromosome segregation ATPase